MSIFFVLSGLSLAHVYHASISSTASALRFFVRRIFRIWPLLTIVVGVVAVRGWLVGTPYSAGEVIMNITGAFGFFTPGQYMTAGAWSIGNEMVYYALTPFLLAAFRAKLSYGIVLTAASVAVGAFIAVNSLSLESTLSDQWEVYVNPFNNLFFFCAGVSLFFLFHSWKPSGVAKAALVLSPLAIFTFMPADGDQITIVTGWSRVAFSIASILSVLALYRVSISLPAPLANLLEWLGTISYGVYLIHPIFISVIRRLPGDLTSMPIVFIAVVSATTIAASFAIYVAIERPMVQIGKVVTR